MIHYAYDSTQFGLIQVGYTDQALVSLKVVPTQESPNCPSALSDQVFAQLREYFDGRRQVFDLPCAPQGTPFQQQVWAALQQIPYGETKTYQEIATAIGNPKASRAVGAANGRNPIWIVVPCHRVVGAHGALTGYAGGLEMKQALLALERKYAGQ